ncbi:MAG: DegV family protein [Anaerolineaceae bacterium]|nr:DegV family protein [Anaerolineaceae bacterium]
MDGLTLFNCFCTGAEEVGNQRQLLNQINVFPVADGDTGNNLIHTMKTVVQRSKPVSSVMETLQSMGSAALYGARGNSGLIFAQFIIGLSQDSPASEWTPQSFVSSLEKGASQAYTAVQTPVEGTILSVIRGFLEYCKENLPSVDSLKTLLVNSLPHLDALVDQTQSQMKVLRDARTVDAGAKGFVTFLHGFVQGLLGRLPHLEGLQASAQQELAAPHLLTERPVQRYCTEFMLQTHKKTDLSALRADLADLGDSFVLGGNQNFIRLHLHTNTPWELTKRIRSYGNILEQKVDDMCMEYLDAHLAHPKIALVVDSMSDLPVHIREHYGIHQVPMNLMVGEQAFLDDLTIDHEMLKEEINGQEKLSTSQPSPAMVQEMFTKLAEHYQAIIGLTVSSGLSGTYNSFVTAAENMKDRLPVRIVDSMQNSSAVGMVAVSIAKDIQAGLELDEICCRAEETRKNATIYVSLTSIDNMVRSGRISKPFGKVANFVRLKPLISIDENGKGSIPVKSLGVRQNQAQLENLLRSHHQFSPITSYSLSYADDTARLEWLKEAAEKIIGFPPAFIHKISPVLLLLAGSGSVAIGFLQQKKGTLK